MFKPTPNPPPVSPDTRAETPESKKLDEAAQRALDYYLNPTDR